MMLRDANARLWTEGQVERPGVTSLQSFEQLRNDAIGCRNEFSIMKWMIKHRAIYFGV